MWLKRNDSTKMTEILLPQIIELLSEVEGGLTAPDIALRLGTDRKTINSFLYRLEGREVERARSLNQTHQWIDLMIMLMLRNDQSLTLYRRRTQLARTASPPAA